MSNNVAFMQIVTPLSIIYNSLVFKLFKIEESPITRIKSHGALRCQILDLTLSSGFICGGLESVHLVVPISINRQQFNFRQIRDKGEKLPIFPFQGAPLPSTFAFVSGVSPVRDKNAILGSNSTQAFAVA